jgi:hypothetical protein
MAISNETVTIHVMHCGAPMCQFLSGWVRVRDWPEGHSFVGLEEVAEANCKLCFKRAKELLSMKKTDEKGWWNWLYSSLRRVAGL